MGLKRTVDATVEPVSLAEARAYLRVDSTSEDALITRLIKVARQRCEEWEWRSYLSQTWELKCDAFPTGGDPFYLPRPPLIAVTSIAYVDTAGAGQTTSASVYAVDTHSVPGRVALAYGQTWPTAREQVNAVTVTYTAGYGTAPTTAPDATKQLILLLVSYYFENRDLIITGTIVQELPIGIQALLRPVHNERTLQYL